MTKTVRIENADTSNWPVRVTVQHKDPETGDWKTQPKGFTQIDYPSALCQNYITSGRRLVIEELGPDAPETPDGDAGTTQHHPV